MHRDEHADRRLIGPGAKARDEQDGGKRSRG